VSVKVKCEKTMIFELKDREMHKRDRDIPTSRD
jgi:hypothetical protein